MEERAILFLKWLRDEMGYPIYDVWSLAEIFIPNVQEILTLWEEWDEQKDQEEWEEQNDKGNWE